MRVVADMHERKAVMAREAEAFIALPGRQPEHSSDVSQPMF